MSIEGIYKFALEEQTNFVRVSQVINLNRS